jgi:hypothetical protein
MAYLKASLFCQILPNVALKCRRISEHFSLRISGKAVINAAYNSGTMIKLQTRKYHFSNIHFKLLDISQGTICPEYTAFCGGSNPMGWHV